MTDETDTREFIDNLLKELQNFNYSDFRGASFSPELEETTHLLKFNAMVPVEIWHCTIKLSGSSGQEHWYARALHWIHDQEWEFTEIAPAGID